MPQERRYLFSAVTNWFAFATTLLVSFFLSPYLIHHLGDAQMGVWIFVESLLAYFTLFDLGIASCVIRFVARSHASRNQHELNRLASSSLVLFLGLGLLALVIGIVLTPLVSPMLAKSGLPPGDIVAFMLLLVANLALTLPLSLFPSILDGLERFAAKSIIRIIVLVLRSTAMVILMEYQPSLMGLGIISLVGNLAEHLLMAIFCWVYLPGLRLARRFVDREMFTQIRGYSVNAFLAMVAGRISVQSGTIVIGIYLSSAEITWFGIALRLVEFAKALLRSATTTLTPAISSLEAAGDTIAIRDVLLKATRWVLYLILPVHLGLIVFGKPFLRIWMGPGVYADHCYPALIILSATLSLVVAQSVASRILYGMGQLKLFARMALLESFLNLGLSLLLVGSLGIVGVAWAAALPNLFFCLYVIGSACRVLGIQSLTYFGETWMRPLISVILLLTVWMTPWSTVSWSGLGVAIMAGLVPYSVLVLLIEGKIRFRSPVVVKRVSVEPTRSVH